MIGIVLIAILRKLYTYLVSNETHDQNQNQMEMQMPMSNQMQMQMPMSNQQYVIQQN